MRAGRRAVLDEPVHKGALTVASGPERGVASSDKASAPITGLAYRTLEDGSATQRLAQPAEAVVDAGCDETRCYAVALAREPGGDGMKPEAMKVLAYP